MASVDEVTDALREVIDPELGLDFVELGLIYEVAVQDANVSVTYTLTSPGCPIGPQVSEQIAEFVSELDGVDDVQTFSYKLVRPSQVTATVVGPDHSTLTLAQDSELAGVHTLQWDDKTAAEGTWHFSVTATDDLGHTTTADRPFAVNQTLGFLQVTPKGAGATATFQLAHAANVTVTVEKANGIVLATLLSKKLDPGPQSVAWSGPAGSGYRVRVVATNAIGKATLLSPLTSRRS